MKRRSIQALVTLAAAAGMLILAACNTIEGVGKDIERGGEKIQDAVK